METNKSAGPHRFQPGNKFGTGRPKGSRNAVQLILEQIGPDNIEKVYNTMLNQALNGRFEAARYILDKVTPNGKGGYVDLPLPCIDSIEKVAEAQEIILQHLAMGAITADDAGKIFNLVELRCKTNERLRYIEAVRVRRSEAGI